MSLGLRIVKVGGSLLTLPDLAKRLRCWLGQQSPATNVLLAGGGILADEVRRWDERFGLGEETSHWLCIDLLDLTAQVLSALLPEAHLFRDYRALRTGSHETLIFAPGTFIRESEARLPGLPLPHSWDATSDSIAARLAEVTRAEELVLLKSSLPKPPFQGADLSGGYVDRRFVQTARSLSVVRLVNLRDDAFAEVKY